MHGNVSGDCGNTFLVKNFGFTDCSSKRFYKSKWIRNKESYFVYRAFVFLHTLGWMVSGAVLYDSRSCWAYLKSWTEITSCLYFFFSFITATVGLTSEIKDTNKLRWFHKLTWIMFNSALGAAWTTDLFYFNFTSHFISSRCFAYPFDIHTFPTSYILLLFDIFVSNIPIRLLHFIYPVLCATMYSGFIVFFSWARHARPPTCTLGIDATSGQFARLVGATVATLLVSHFFHFGFYHLKKRFLENRSKKFSLRVHHVVNVV